MKKYYGKITLILSILFFSYLSFGNIWLPEYNSGDQIINHKYYSLKYNKSTKQADWVAFSITREMIINGKNKLTYLFKPDPIVSSIDSSSIKDYLNSGYVCGQLCPSFLMQISPEAMNESFFMSNVTPQDPYFNYFIWNTLKSKIRQWALENKEIFIVTGPIFYKSKKRTKIGKNEIVIPDAFFCIILDFKISKSKAIAFILPNKKTDSQFQSYATTIDHIEEITGINFFPELPRYIEGNLESKYDYNLWK
jgi:endonuclease G, mitochondrial